MNRPERVGERDDSGRAARPTIAYEAGRAPDFQGHIFPVEKYELTYMLLAKAGLLEYVDVVAPPPASREDLLLAHEPGYVDDFLGSVSSPAMLSSELPVADDIRDFFLATTGGSILAVRHSLARGVGMNLGGGFHHAFPDHAEGFCYINDIAVSICRAKADGLAKRVLVVDCDVHQGNGTAVMFSRDPDVFTFSIHQEHNYPMKQRSDLDIGLDDFTGDEEYLDRLGSTVPALLDSHEPELVFYVAGADTYKDDQLGGLRLTKEGLRRRDEIVIGETRERGACIAIAFAGGYAFRTQDVADIHFTTCRIAIEQG